MSGVTSSETKPKRFQKTIKKRARLIAIITSSIIGSMSLSSSIFIVICSARFKNLLTGIVSDYSIRLLIFAAFTTTASLFFSFSISLICNNPKILWGSTSCETDSEPRTKTYPMVSLNTNLMIYSITLLLLSIASYFFFDLEEIDISKDEVLAISVIAVIFTTLTLTLLLFIPSKLNFMNQNNDNTLQSNSNKECGIIAQKEVKVDTMTTDIRSQSSPQPQGRNTTEIAPEDKPKSHPTTVVTGTQFTPIDSRKCILII